MPVAWISGASSGLGLYTARALQGSGWRVVAGARSFADPEQLLPQDEQQLRLPLDVTDADSVQAFAQEALARHGAPDALINAAGLTLLGAGEEYTVPELERLMDVNFLGMVRMTQAALPLMRQAGRGTVVNFSSINGLLATPFQGAYTASKHAVEGYSEALRMELMPHGVRVMVVQPGDHQGGQQRYRGHSARTIPAYQQARQRAGAAIARDEGSGSQPAVLGLKVAAALNRRRPPATLRVAMFTQRLAVWLHDLLPAALFSRTMAAYYGVHRRD